MTVEPETWASFYLTDSDLDRVRRATSTAGGVQWEREELSEIKRRIKNLHLRLQAMACCYCRRHLLGEFAMVIDIEHIVPKSTYPWAIFEPVNLTVSCKRCNMGIKRAKVDFLRSAIDQDVRAGINDSGFYSFIHPNLDNYKDHLSVVQVAVDDKRFLKYLAGRATDKGRQTYYYFRLAELEIDTLDEIQGMQASPTDHRALTIRRILGLSS